MSFFSSLLLFYPGTPPQLKVDQLRDFGSHLMPALQMDSDPALTLSIKWGDRIDQDYRSTEEDEPLDDAGIISVIRDYDWDIHRQGEWENLWAGIDSKKNIYRAYLSLGSLPQLARQALQTRGSDDQWASPDSVSIIIDPVCPAKLNSMEDVCTGLVRVAFSGYGYFSWRPVPEFAQHYQVAPPIIAAQSICKKFFPVSQNDRFTRVARHLDELFLNRSNYQPGDWILSIRETG